MTGIIFPAEKAVFLNKRVQDEIDQSLYLFCNYSPCLTIPSNPDGIFFYAVLNMYQFTKDTSCILPCFRKIIKNDSALLRSLCTDIKRLEDIISFVTILRSVLAHNNALKNGYLEQANLDSYSGWLIKITGEKELSSEADFLLVNQELKNMGDEVLDILDKLITSISYSPQKKAIVVAWKNRIITWYLNKEDVFLGQLGDLYIARAAAKGITLSVKNLSYKMSYWIRCYYLSEVETILNQLTLLKNSCVVGSKGYEDIVKKTKEFEEKRFSIEQETKEIVRATEISVWNYKKRFFLEFKELLLKILEEENCTMFPDDIMQRLIQKYFASVPSADF